MVCRQYTQSNIGTFSEMVNQVNWNVVLEETHCQKAYPVFHDKFIECYEKCFPLKKVKIGYRTRKRWLTDRLKSSISTKNKLYMKSKKCATTTNTAIYKQYKHKLSSLLCMAERNHYEGLFKQYKSNIRKSWVIIKEIINKKQSGHTSDTFLINGNWFLSIEICFE